MKKKKTSISMRILKLCCITVLLASVIIAASLVIVTGVSLEDTVDDEMTAMAATVADEVEQGIDGNFKFLEALATNSVVYDTTMDPMEQKQILMDIAADQGIDDLGFIDLNGDTVTAAMITANLAERAYYQEALAGNRFASDPIPDSTQEGVMLMMLAVPVYKDGLSSSGQIVGVLYSRNDGNFLSNITNEVAFGDTGMAYMINDAGTNIAYADADKVYNQENAIEMFADQAEFSSLIEMLNKARGSEAGVTTYTYNGTTKYVGYAPATEFGWHVLVCADQSELFAGENQAVALAIIITIIVMIIAIVATIFLVRRMVAPLVRLNTLNGALSEGDLTSSVDVANDAKINDEIGQMVESTDTFVGKLKGSVTQIKDSSDNIQDIADQLKDLAAQSSQAGDSVCSAIEDVSQATVQQATEVDTASNEIAVLGTAVTNINEDVNKLLELAQVAKSAEDASQNALEELISSNEKTSVAFAEISEQINATGAAADKISEAANLITEIASQTNLLSLNASIEAARAGEAGKGFAVVATEIQQLSVQSNGAASTIQEIIDELTEGSRKSISKMDEALVLIKAQQESLAKTEQEASTVADDVSQIETGAKQIRNSVEDCKSATDKINDVVVGLAAISQENAASAEETNAAMEELNANIGIIASNSEQLAGIADDLATTMEFWSV